MKRGSLSLRAIGKMVAAAAVAAFGLAAGGPAAAQSPQWDALVAAAKKEGVLVLGGPISVPSRAFLLERWSRDFPDIKMQFTAAAGFQWSNRIRAEREAGNYLWDVFFSGPNVAVYQLAREGVFNSVRDAWVLPELTAPETWRLPLDQAFADEGRRLFTPFQQTVSPFYNAKLVSPEKVEKLGIKVLLEPEYKGKIAWFDPRIGGPGSNDAVFLHKVIGDDDMKRVIVDQDSKFFRNTGQAVEAMVRESAAFVLGVALDREAAQYRAAGLKFDFRRLGNTATTAYETTGGAVLALIDRAPNPNAAKLFANWILTRDVLRDYVKADQWNTIRADVEPIDPSGLPAKGESYIAAQREALVADKAKTQDFIRALRP